MMSAKKAIKARYLHTLWVALIIMFVVWLMSILECNMATPAY